MIKSKVLNTIQTLREPVNPLTQFIFLLTGMLSSHNCIARLTLSSLI
jgi:hypothetical protein